jgi:hypothetical protein
MLVKQTSITLDNIPGSFSKAVDYLGENGVNIIALSVADAADISIVRIITNDPEKALNILKSRGYSVKINEVLALEVPNRPGGLDAILKPLKKILVNINYLYTCLRIGENTVLIVGVDKIAEALQVLRENTVYIYGEELYKL